MFSSERFDLAQGKALEPCAFVRGNPLYAYLRALRGEIIRYCKRGTVEPVNPSKLRASNGACASPRNVGLQGLTLHAL